MNIKIALPTRGSFHYRLVWFLLRRKQEGISFMVNKNVEGAAYNRNTICKMFLVGDESHLLMIDDDTVPPTDLDIQRLIDFDKDVLVLPYPLNMNTQDGANYVWSIFTEPMTFAKKQGKGLEKIFAAGTGFVQRIPGHAAQGADARRAIGRRGARRQGTRQSRERAAGAGAVRCGRDALRARPDAGQAGRKRHSLRHALREPRQPRRRECNGH